MPTSLQIDNAEVTYCFNKPSAQQKDPTGMTRTPVHQLPWAFVRYAPTDDTAVYVMPLPPWARIVNGPHSAQIRSMVQTEPKALVASVGNCFMEYMDNLPFPQAKRSSDSETKSDGYVHFFGGI